MQHPLVFLYDLLNSRLDLRSIILVFENGIEQAPISLLIVFNDAFYLITFLFVLLVLDLAFHLIFQDVNALFYFCRVAGNLKNPNQLLDDTHGIFRTDFFHLFQLFFVATHLQPSAEQTIAVIVQHILNGEIVLKVFNRAYRCVVTDQIEFDSFSHFLLPPAF